MTATEAAQPAGTLSSESADHVPSTTGEKRVRVPAIDGFRGYAAIAVLLFHVTYAAGRPPLDEGIIRNVLISGYMGVDFFFVISGFLLFLPAVTNGGRLGDLRSYALRRAARIIPAYYLLLVGVVVLHSVIVNIPTALPHTSLRGVLSFFLHLTFLQHTIGLLLGIPEGFAIQGAVWTLTLEALFYVLLPLVAGWYFRHPLVGLAAALAVSALWKYAAIHVPFSVSWLAGGDRDSLRLMLVTQLPTYAAHFAAGMTGAWLFVKLRSVNARAIPAGAVLAQALALIVIILSMRSAGIRDLRRVGGLYTDASGRWYYDHWTDTTYVALAFAVLLVATALAPRWGRWPVTNRVARFLGDASYGVYLWHLVVIGFAFQTLNFAPDRTGLAFVRMLTVTLVASLIAGWLSFVSVERPFIRWARRRSRRREQPSATVAPPQPAQVPAVPHRGAHW